MRRLPIVNLGSFLVRLRAEVSVDPVASGGGVSGGVVEPGDGRGDAQLDDVSWLDSLGEPAGIEVVETLGEDEILALPTVIVTHADQQFVVGEAVKELAGTFLSGCT